MNKLHVATFAILTIALTSFLENDAMENNNTRPTRSSRKNSRLATLTAQMNALLNSHQETTTLNNENNLENPVPQSTSYAAHQELGTVLGNFDKPLRRQLFPKFE